MHKWPKRLASSAIPLLLLGQAALGQESPFGGDPFELDPNATVNLFITSPSYSGCGTFDEGQYPDCDQLISAPQPGMAFLWVILSRQGGFPQGTGSVEFGIEHSGLDILGWASCGGAGGQSTADWPASGSGTGIAWSLENCERSGETAKAGYFTLSDGASGAIALVPHPFYEAALWGNCTGAPSFMICPPNLSGAILAQGTAPICGDNCSGTPTEETSWSAVKAMFR